MYNPALGIIASLTPHSVAQSNHRHALIQEEKQSSSLDAEAGRSCGGGAHGMQGITEAIILNRTGYKHLASVFSCFILSLFRNTGYNAPK